MATETWLYLNNTEEFLSQISSAYKIAEILLSGDVIPDRLEKNYWLLLMQYGILPSSIVAGTNDDSLILESVKQLADKEDVYDLLNYVEPSLIRERYYTGKRSEDADYDFPS